ncbi:MAG: DRTGG domain-containing protein [Chloroflexi bacterium]|nr:DRTGG domain-containing protein [Chloroflexota bacterium]MCY3697799.1 DRTGG domain-containing protein [Chloroflexota bacterium]
MASILVTSTLPGDGKSVVAAGIAAALRATGATVRLERVGDSDSASADAVQLSQVNGVRSSGQPVAPTDIALDTDHVVIEAGDASGIEGDRTVLVTRHGEADDDTVARALESLAPDLVVINAVPQYGDAEAIARVSGMGASTASAVCALPQDRHLAAPTVNDIAPAIEGALSGDEALFDESSRDLVIGPVSAHEGMDYFRKYPDKTLVTRHDRIDIALGALDYEPLCLILAGGEPTLPYVAQRAERESFALITTSMSTLEAVEAIGELYGRAAFVGRRKLDTAIDLVGSAVSLDPLT